MANNIPMSLLMSLGPRLAESLTVLGGIMRAAHDPWWVIASAAVALHGADPGPVADVDILLSVDDALRILPSLGVAVQQGTQHPDFRSCILGQWHGAPLPAEFMAGFCHRSGSEWVPVHPATRQRIDVDGVAVFVPERAELVRLLERFGRPKDIERARRLALLG